MAGGGHIIIRRSIKRTLSDPLVHGSLPAPMLQLVDPVLAKDVNDWSDVEDITVLMAFSWAAYHC